MLDFSALLLDMDGIVIDSEPLHEEAQQEVFRDFNLEVPDSVLPSFKGMTEQDVFSRIVLDYAPHGGDIATLIAAKERAYRKLLKNVALIPGALSFIRNAHGRFRIALTTSSVRSDQQFAFDKFGLAPYFEAIVTAEDIVNPKPHPQPYITTAEKLGLDPTDCLVVEDSLNGIRSALGAGCVVAGMTTSFGHQELEGAGAHFTVDTYDQLAQRLGLRLD